MDQSNQIKREAIKKTKQNKNKQHQQNNEMLQNSGNCCEPT